MTNLPARLARKVMSKICDPQTCEVLWHPTFEADIAAAIREALEESEARLAKARADIAWLLEFVIEPEFFPNQGDRQYWQERLRALEEPR